MSDMGRISIAKVAVVTIALMIIGAVIGALTSAVALIIVSILQGARSYQAVMFGVSMAGSVGAAIGALMAPLVAWILLRRVPLWRAITQTALGTLIGAIVASFTTPGPILGAFLGFTLAAIRLHIVTRPRPALPDTEPPPTLP